MSAYPFRWLQAAICAALLLCCGLPAGAREVQVAFATTVEPFVFPRRNSGIEIEIVRTALQRMGHELVPVYVPAARLGHEFERKAVDAAATSLPEPGASGFYSEPYIAYENVAVTLAARKFRLGQIGDLAGLRVVAFQRASQYLGDEYRRAVYQRPGYQEIGDHLAQNRLLYRGAADAIVIERHIFEYQDRLLAAGKFSEKPQQVTIHKLFTPIGYRMRFQDQTLRDAFDLEIAAITQLGIPEAIARKYGY